MASSGAFDRVSNIQVSIASVVGLGVILTVFCFAYGELVSGEATTPALRYTIAGVGAGAVLLVAVFKARRFAWAVYPLALLFGVEAVLATKFVVLDKRHHVATAQANERHARYVDRYRDRFSHHPMLSGIPTPNYRSNAYNHTAKGTRVTAAPKDPEAPTIVTIGGSTTYEGANDRDSWPSLLAERANLNVVNMGVLGYSSAEHVVQTAFWVPEYQPSCAVYYVGWNDLRSVGVRDLQPDYGGFHLERQGMMLGVNPHAYKFYRPGDLEYSAVYATYNGWRRRQLDRFLSGDFPWWRDTADAGEVTSDVDARALAYFVRNMNNIIVLNRSRNIRTILIPQVMNFAHLRPEDLPARPWTPFLAVTAKKVVLDAYHRALAELAADDVSVLAGVLAQDWRKEHFIDEGHFTPAGSAMFAAAIADDIAALCRSTPGD